MNFVSNFVESISTPGLFSADIEVLDVENMCVIVDDFKRASRIFMDQEHHELTEQLGLIFSKMQRAFFTDGKV